LPPSEDVSDALPYLTFSVATNDFRKASLEKSATNVSLPLA
jgi:hypothetical protein